MTEQADGGIWREWLESVPVGQLLEGTTAGPPEDGAWRLRLIDNHILIEGLPPSSRTSMVWSIIAGAAPAVMAGVVELWGVDSEHSVLARGRGVFERYVAACGDGLGLIEEAVAVIYERTGALAERGRKFTPSPDLPLIVVVIDQLQLYGRTRKTFEKLLTLGRAVGFSVVSTVDSDPEQKIWSIRGSYPTRVYKDYVVDNGSERRRVRAYWVRDEAIKKTEAAVTAARTDAVLG